MQVCKYASMQICKYVSMQVYKYASMQECKYVSMIQVCKYAHMHVCMGACNVYINASMQIHSYSQSRQSWVIFWPYIANVCKIMLSIENIKQNMPILL